MPPGVARLPRSRGGLPVPTVAQRAGEDLMRIAPCPYASGRRAVFPADAVPADATPEFGVMEPSRQRRAVMDFRCQVCDDPLVRLTDVPRTDGAFLWLADMLQTPDTMPGHGLALEPWVCDDCLGYALAVCPGLVRYPQPERARAPIPVEERLVRLLAVWTGNAVATVIKPHGNLEGEPPCVGYLKIEPLRYRRLLATHFLELGPAELRRQLMAEGPPS